MLGDPIVALGAHLLHEGVRVRTAAEGGGELMNLNLSAIAVRERAVTLFFILLLVAAGAYAFVKLGRAEDPTFTIKILTVTAAWPGATAREMQDLVAEPLEKRLQELTWYDRVETTTRPGYAYMVLTLKDNTPPSVVQEEFYQARKKLGDEARNLPPGVFGPFVNDEYSDVSFALYALEGQGHADARAGPAGRGDPPGPAARARRQEGQHPRRASGADLRRVLLRQAGDPRRVGAGYLRRLAAAEHRHAGGLDRHQAGRRSSSVSTAPMTIVQKIADTPIVAAGAR